MQYENLLVEYEKNLVIKEKALRAYDGRICDNKILIRKDMDTVRKSCVLAEELGHYFTTVGNILDQTDSNNRKQERRARLWAYDRLIGLSGIIDAFIHGCENLTDIAEHLDVTEDFLSDALKQYEAKYGTNVIHGRYKISFSPTLEVRLRKKF